jgi:hypothetical protein
MAQGGLMYGAGFGLSAFGVMNHRNEISGKSNESDNFFRRRFTDIREVVAGILLLEKRINVNSLNFLDAQFAATLCWQHALRYWLRLCLYSANSGIY